MMGMVWGINVNLKKAEMSMSFLIGVIIPLIAFVITVPIVTNYIGGDDSEKMEGLCRASVSARAASTIKIDTAEFKTTPIMCKTIDKTVEEDTKKEVKKLFADKLARCWWMFGEGRYRSSIFDKLDIMGGTNRCFICYTLIVEEGKNFKKKDKIGVEEFKDFLMDEYHPKIKGYTYLNYFQNYRGGKGAVVGILTTDGIAPGRTYAIGFKSKKSKCKWCDKISFGGGAMAALGAGALLLAIPTGGTSLMIGGGILVAGGATASIVSGSQMINEEFFKDVNIDSIYLVDMSHDKLGKYFDKNCEKITDSGGR